MLVVDDEVSIKVEEQVLLTLEVRGRLGEWVEEVDEGLAEPVRALRAEPYKAPWIALTCEVGLEAEVDVIVVVVDEA